MLRLQEMSTCRNQKRKKVAVLTSGILPVPAVQGGAVEALIDAYLEYNNRHHLCDITVYSVYHPKVKGHRALASTANHYIYVDTCSLWGRVKRCLHGLFHRKTYYHYSIDYYFQQTLKMLKTEAYDQVIVENRPAYGPLLRSATAAEVIYHLHNDFLNEATRHGREMFDAADKIVTVSNYIRSRVDTCGLGTHKTVTVHNGIDLTAYEDNTDSRPRLSRAALGLDPTDFVAVFCGRLIPEKGIQELIEAMVILQAEKHIKLLVIGNSFYGKDKTEDDFGRTLKKTALPLQERVVFVGYVQHSEIPAYLHLADVAIVPSVWDDPFPTTILEAQAAGLPVISTLCGGIPEMVTNQTAILLPVTCDFTTNLANAILYLSQHQEEREYMGRCSRVWSQKFSKDAYSKAFFDVLMNQKQNKDDAIPEPHA